MDMLLQRSASLSCRTVSQYGCQGFLLSGGFFGGVFGDPRRLGEARAEHPGALQPGLPRPWKLWRAPCRAPGRANAPRTGSTSSVLQGAGHQFQWGTFFRRGFAPPITFEVVLYKMVIAMICELSRFWHQTQRNSLPSKLPPSSR